MMRMGLKMLGTSAVLSKINDLRTEGNPEYVVGTNVEYAPYVEFGTRYMSAQPYMRPAAEKTSSNLEGVIRDAADLEAAVKLAALNVEKEAKKNAPVDTGRLKNSITAEPR